MTITIHKSEDLTPEERAAVEQFDNCVVTATNCTSLIWVVALDDKDRRYLQLRKYPDRGRCFLEAIQSDLEQWSNDELKDKIISTQQFELAKKTDRKPI